MMSLIKGVFLFLVFALKEIKTSLINSNFVQSLPVIGLIICYIIGTVIIFSLAGLFVLGLIF